MGKKKQQGQKSAICSKRVLRPPTSEVVLSRCPRCGSTEREMYRKPRREVCCRGIRDGKAYTHVIFRTTACTACGQVRRDVFYENRTD
jgi:uncharacterized Zn finger protein